MTFTGSLSMGLWALQRRRALGKEGSSLMHRQQKLESDLTSVHSL